jgi:hypothetical protein
VRTQINALHEKRNRKTHSVTDPQLAPELHPIPDPTKP